MNSELTFELPKPLDETEAAVAVGSGAVVSLLAYLDKCAKPLEMMLKNFKGSRKYKKWWTGEMRALNKARTTAKALVKEKQANDGLEPSSRSKDKNHLRVVGCRCGNKWESQWPCAHWETCPACGDMSYRVCSQPPTLPQPNGDSLHRIVAPPGLKSLKTPIKDGQNK